MANNILTPTHIAREALMQLENNLVLPNVVHRRYRREWEGIKKGATVNIRKPVKFTAQDGATLIKQDVEEGNTDIVVDQRKHVGWEFLDQDLTLSIEEYSERYIKPATISLANQVDADIAARYVDVWNHVGTPGTTPANFLDVGAAGQRLDEMAVPKQNRSAVWDPAAAWSLADGLKSTFVQILPDKALPAFEEASFGRYAGFTNYADQNIKKHTVGAHGGTPLTNGAAQETTYAASLTTNTASLITDGWTASTAILNAGDVFTIANVFAVNPVSKDTQDFLQQFVVTAAATSDGGGNATLTISPAPILTGPYQNISATIADGAAITVVGTASTIYPQNLAFHENAFALVMIPLEMPDGAPFKARESKDGISIRVIKAYDIINSTDIIRLDILYGVKTIYPDLACRVTG